MAASTNFLMLPLLLLLAFHYPRLTVAASSNVDPDTTNYQLLNDVIHDDPDTTKYILVSQLTSSNSNQRVQARCFANNRCFRRILTCPQQCPTRASIKPGASSCFIDCSQKCETSCKHRRPKCYGFGAVCYDPRFVGGDGVMFYFHGKAGENFCLVSDRNLHVNAHFIGRRPEGRNRDFTWVQAVAIMFDNHKLSLAAKKVTTWDEKVDQLRITHDGLEIAVPEGDGSMWTSPENDVKMERLANTNSIQVTIPDIMSLSVSVVPITDEDNRVHNYQIPKDDCFAHLELQFKFFRLSSSVEGVLGQTYQPDFKNPVKVGVRMPIIGGEDKYRVSSLFATDCKASKFAPHADTLVSGLPMTVQAAKCVNSATTGGGIVCRR